MLYGFQNNLHLEIKIIYYLFRSAARPLINSLKTPYSLPEGRDRCSFQRVRLLSLLLCKLYQTKKHSHS